MNTYERLMAFLCKRLSLVAGVALVAMMSIVVCNIISRSIYKPIFGTYEIVRYLGLVIATFGLAFTQFERGHIGVDILTSRLKERVRAAVDAINNLFLIALSALVTWQAVLYALKLWRTGTLSPTLALPLHVFLFMLAFSFVTLGLVCLSQLLKSLGILWK